MLNETPYMNFTPFRISKLTEIYHIFKIIVNVFHNQIQVMIERITILIFALN